MPETPDPQTVYNLNKNNALQVADQLLLPQGAVNINTDRNMNADNIQQVTVQQKQSTGIISVRSNSLNTGSSVVSVSITKHRSHKIRHHLDVRQKVQESSSLNPLQKAPFFLSCDFLPFILNRSRRKSFF